MLWINTFSKLFFFNLTSVLNKKCIQDSSATMFDETSPKSLLKVKTLKEEDDCEAKFSSIDSKICHFELPHILGFAAALLLRTETQKRKEWGGQIDHQPSQTKWKTSTNSTRNPKGIRSNSFLFSYNYFLPTKKSSFKWV